MSCLRSTHPAACRSSRSHIIHELRCFALAVCRDADWIGWSDPGMSVWVDQLIEHSGTAYTEKIPLVRGEVL